VLGSGSNSVNYRVVKKSSVMITNYEHYLLCIWEDEDLYNNGILIYLTKILGSKYSQIMHINNNNLFPDTWFTNISTL
jgi:hypothetical protein